ncbi:alpha/beta hydrolase [Chloroflexota bacterium]
MKLAFESPVSTIIWIVIVIAGVYILFAVYLFAFQSRQIYLPDPVLITDPSSVGLDFENVSLKTEDGIKLSAWYIPSESTRGVILFCHGNAGNISHRLESIQIFNRLGLDVLIFDYRGYGRSDGKPTEIGTYMDSEAAWQYLVEERQVSPSRIIVFGRSLGGAVAAWLSHEHTPGVLILEATFTSATDMAVKMYPYFPVRLLSRFNYNTADYLKEVNCPVLIVHSPEDEIIPISHGKQLFEIAKGPKEFLEVTGTHNEGFLTSREFYEGGLNAFVSEYLPPDGLK